MPRTPALYASAEELDEAESKLDVRALVAQGVHETTVERFYYRGGKVEVAPPKPRTAKAERERTAIA
jgi:hypothetical protein